MSCTIEEGTNEKTKNEYPYSTGCKKYDYK